MSFRTLLLTFVCIMSNVLTHAFAKNLFATNTFITPSYEVIVIEHCDINKKSIEKQIIEEEAMSEYINQENKSDIKSTQLKTCHQVSFTIKNKNSGTIHFLRGKALFSSQSDNVIKQLFYDINDGEYIITNDLTLLCIRKGQILLREKGQWLKK